MRRAGTRIRVTAQLINAADGYHLWSERYDRELADVFAVQDEIAAAIARALEIKLTLKPATPDRYKPNLPAYEAYLMARRHATLIGREVSWERARESYERAIALDPQFALAYAALATHYLGIWVLGLGSPLEAIREAQVLTQRALDLNPSLPEAHSILAFVRAEWDCEWEEAGRHFALAMAQESVGPEARQRYAVYLIAVGRPHDAVAQMRRAVEEDPLYPRYRLFLAASFWAAGDPEAAGRELRYLSEFDQNYPSGLWLLAVYHASQGEWGDALRFAERAHAQAPQIPLFSATLAGVLARTGDARRAEMLLGTLGPPETLGVPRARALFHLMQGDAEQAAMWWEKMIDQRDYLATGAPRVWAKALLSSPRWPALAKRMNLPSA